MCVHIYIQGFQFCESIHFLGDNDNIHLIQMFLVVQVVLVVLALLGVRLHHGLHLLQGILSAPGDLSLARARDHPSRLLAPATRVGPVPEK